nr:SUMF1/EgtB/PvdO family nonheme iron enzyme [Pontiella desulfatans]
MAVDRDAAVTAYGTVYVLPTEDEWYKAAYLKSDGSAYSLYATGDSVPGVETDANYDGYNGTYSTPWDVGTGGVAENNGTFYMNGNVWEWNESAYDGTLDDMAELRVVRGGAFSVSELGLRSSTRHSYSPESESYLFGFRVAAIPEPSSIMLVGVAGGFALFIRRRLMV